MAKVEKVESRAYRVIVVGGHTRNIGKTQLVCDLIAALPDANFVAGKITQFGHGVCAQNGEFCGCAPDDHTSAFDWESDATSGTDSARFLQAGARRSFWLRTKQGFLAEGLPLLRESLGLLADEHASEAINLIVESNSLLQFLKPGAYLAVLDPQKQDFKPSAQSLLDRADAFVLRHAFDAQSHAWPQISTRLLQNKPAFLQKESQPIPVALLNFVRSVLTNSPASRI
ncbi:MAG: hypothetical protein JSS69_04910 [Acidobacteria bacterium]|nr:hypothetical protein [Acidobacteriota bacterium]MBS1865239.1 hypothetical protein [Acidobacteriota bacterium]